MVDSPTCRRPVRAHAGFLRNVPVLGGLVLAILAAAAPARAADLFLNDEPEVYAAIDKLSALGYLPGFLANTRPYSMQAVRAAAETASRTSVPEGFDGELLRWLVSYSAPTAMDGSPSISASATGPILPCGVESKVEQYLK